MRAIWKWAVASALWLAPTCLQAASEDLAALERKAAGGDAAALFALGDMYERGDGVAHDMAMAAAYMRLAAEHGSAVAQYRLGLVQAVGLGVEANVTEGYKWLSVAAIISPPGLTIEAQVATKAFTSVTCSTTSIASTTSKHSPAAARSSAVVAR